MNSNTKNSIRIGFILILIVVISGIILIGPIKKEQSFEIKDRCGPVMNFISHTIQDESACKLQCRSQCETKGWTYSNIIFEEKPIGCNSCVCYCKEGLFG